MQQQREVCAICLATANPRGGGEFLCSPGCCGKWFHQSCIEDMKRAGKSFCPACMKAFPISAPVQAPPAPPAPAPYPTPVPPPPNVFNFNLNNNNNVPSPPTATGIFARMNSHNQVPTMPGTLQEDEITPSDSPVKIGKVVKGGDSKGENELQIIAVPEYPDEGLAEKTPFHVRVSVVFTPDQTAAQPRNGLDVVCVLDNSGSMSGSKIDNLKRAMEFVISTLTDQDRLSIVTFNSTATPLQGLWKMTTTKKDASKNIIRSITAGGGTDIYRGMQAGWQMLQQRRTKNPASCMFLLTDGQDGSYLAEKKQLAKTMREQGTSLFVFGFGNDHDSAHLLEIANAGEGSFVYIETNDTVIDAFGGAIGSQQGQLLRNIQVEFQMSALNIVIESVLAGSYLSEVDQTWKRSGKVKFADLYGGEKRDFLLQLRIPAVVQPTAVYELLTVRAHYQRYGDDETVLTSVPQGCSIARVSALPASRARNPEVDEQVQRIEVTTAIEQAMQAADRGDYKQGKEALEQRKRQVESSVAYQRGNPIVRGLIDDINNCQQKISSRDEYVTFGGRAMMSETATTYSRQRAVYAKNSNMMYMQSAMSSACQTSALDFRNNNYVTPPPPLAATVPSPSKPSTTPADNNKSSSSSSSWFNPFGGSKK